MYLCCSVSNTSVIYCFEKSVTILYKIFSINDSNLKKMAILITECVMIKLISYNEVIEDFTSQNCHSKIYIHSTYVYVSFI